MIKLIVSGRVGQDAEVKNVGDNTVCSFSVAHTEKVYGATPSEKTIWVTASIWGERGIKLAPHILKGTYVVIERLRRLFAAWLIPLNLAANQRRGKIIRR